MNDCERCADFAAWRGWAQTEPASLREFLAALHIEHMLAAHAAEIIHDLDLNGANGPRIRKEHPEDHGVLPGTALTVAALRDDDGDCDCDICEYG